MKKFQKKLFYSLFLLFLFGMVYYLSNSIDFSSLTVSKNKDSINSFVSDHGNIQLYFCPQDDCGTAFISFLDSAQQSLRCALYEIDLPSVQQKLLQKQKTIDVKIVTDDEYLKQFNHSFVKADSWGLMHNKFCVVDGKKVSTGSMNPTVNDAHKNNNNLLLIESSVLAQNYEDEFQEMWNETFKKGNPIKNPSIKIGEITIQNYFCPEDHCAEHVKEELKKAQKSIYYMTFSFTHEGIANAILLRNFEDDIAIKGIFETRGTGSEYSKFKVFEYQGIDVIKDKNPGAMHHKVFVIDNETVITGSFNPTEGGDERNDENIVIIKDKEIATEFVKEFRSLLATASQEGG